MKRPHSLSLQFFTITIPKAFLTQYLLFTIYLLRESPRSTYTVSALHYSDQLTEEGITCISEKPFSIQTLLSIDADMRMPCNTPLHSQPTLGDSCTSVKC